MTANQRAETGSAGQDVTGGPFAHEPVARRMAALSFPADKDYLALARTTAMHVAGLLGLPISRVTDLRLAVDEACTAFLTAGRAAGAAGVLRETALRDTLDLRYDQYPGQLWVSVRAPVPPSWPEVDEIGWTMLQALVSEVRTEVDDGIGTLILIEELAAPPHPA
jgi:anti-sigma regulatory factor (Ser/Thr protein kinase)